MIWIIVALLSLFSVLAVYSSTGTLAFKSMGSNSYIIKHVAILLGGLAMMYLCYVVPYKRYSKLSPILLLIAGLLLIYTLFFGTSYNDARRWLTLPIAALTFQPSDFAKLALIIYVARTISAKQTYIKDFKSAFLPIIVPIVIICGLIAPADLSTAILLFTTCFLLMLMGRVALRYLFILLVAGVAVFGLLVVAGKAYPRVVRVDTWASRLDDFMNNQDGQYQIQQGKIAIVKGGLIGVGPGNSMQRNYIPHPYSDFIYAVIIEEYGLFGGGVVILLYLGLFFRCVRIVTRSPKAFGAMLALGLGLVLTLQAFLHMGVVAHLIPATGLPLPMISMGGTSVIFTCMTIGIILSVSRHIENAV